MSATVEKAKANWTGYWNQPGVADGFGGKETPEQNPKYYLEEKPILDLIPRCSSILDAGCGIGRYTQLVRSKCKIYVGVDYSEKMLEQARRNTPESTIAGTTITFVQGDLETMDFGMKFDVGLLIAIIRHLPYEKGLVVLKHVANACKLLFFTATIIPEEKEVPMIVKGIPPNIILDHPFHLSDIKKTLNVNNLEAIPIGDRDPTEGARYLFKVGEEITQVYEPPKHKPWNRISTFRRAIKSA